MNYALHPDAEAEYLEAIAYYETRRPGLGASLIADFEHAAGRICQAPDRYPVAREPDIRRLRLRRFPLNVLYREAQGTLQILALAHHRRRPAYWLGRL